MCSESCATAPLAIFCRRFAVHVDSFKTAWLHEQLPKESAHHAASLGLSVSDAWLAESRQAVAARMGAQPQDPRAAIYAWLETQGA